MIDPQLLRGQKEYIAVRMAQREEFEGDFLRIVRLVRRVRPVGAETRMLEIGAGLGWFEVYAELHGLMCEGIEHNPEFVELAAQLGAEFGVSPTIHRADAQTWDYGRERWDVIIATSLFEHIRDHRRLLAKAYDALVPGGALFFYSTNKWSLRRSGEYPALPFYGWLPYAMREEVRVRATGDRGIVDRAGIDFHQFTYWGVRRDMGQAGFTRMVDRVDLADPSELRDPRPTKKAAVRAVKVVPPLRLLARVFASGNLVIALKDPAA